MKTLAFQKVAVAGVLAAAVVLAGSAAIEAQDAPAAEPKAILDSYELMELLFEHQFEELKEGSAAEPADRNGWKLLYDKANHLAEVSNLLYFRDTEDYEKTPEWDAMTAESQAAALGVVEAVKTKDIAAVQAKVEELRVSCNKCHKHFLGDDGPIIE